MTHDSHEEGYRYQQPQACIDELRAGLERIRDHYDDTALAAKHMAAIARATLERTK